MDEQRDLRDLSLGGEGDIVWLLLPRHGAQKSKITKQAN
jgi:hypothetical protein